MLKCVSFMLLVQSFLQAAPLQAQEYLAAPTPLQVRFTRMQSAFEDWRLSDPNVERDVFKADPAKILTRIDMAEKRLTLFLDARKQYYQGLLDSVMRDSATISQIPDAGGEGRTREARKSANEQSALLAARADELTRTAAELAKQPGGTDTSERIQKERDSINMIRDALRKEVETLDAMMDQGSKVKTLRESLRRSQEALAGSIRRDMTAAEADRALWTTYYESLRGVAKGREADKPVTTPKAPVPQQDLKAPAKPGMKGGGNANEAPSARKDQ
jgi:hypothetical protein